MEKSLIEELFFELIQIALGHQKILSRCLDETEWDLLFYICKEHALIGFGYAAIISLPTEQRPQQKQLTLWYAYADKIKKRNTFLTAECKSVCEEFMSAGLQCVVIKGQSNLSNYPDWLRDYRTPGDIDFWCWASGTISIPPLEGQVERSCYYGIRGVIEYCKWKSNQLGRTILWHRILYYHVELTEKSGFTIEPHYRPSYLNCMWRNVRLQRWFEEMRSKVIAEPIGSFPIPTNSFNAIYQLLHIYKHLFEEGIGLRQILDYYFVLVALYVEHREGNNVFLKSEINKLLDSFGMKKFAAAMMFVLEYAFLAPKEILLCLPDEREGRFLLNEIMLGGNFGKHDVRIHHSKSTSNHAFEKLKHNLRLINHYPEEVLWEPFFRVYHWIWRRCALWKFNF